MEPKDQENLHRWLERALVEYGNTEPRSGLEARVLANLSAERERITAEGRAHLLKYHTCERRAEYFLNICQRLV